MVLTQMQIEALYIEVPGESFAIIDSPDNDDLANLRVEVKNSSDETEDIFFLNRNGEKIPEDDYLK